MEKMDKNNSALLLRLPEELKAALQRQANLNGRRITSEINMRLRDSLKETPAPGIAPVHKIQSLGEHTATVLTTAPDDPFASPKGEKLHPTDTAMLAIFRALPADKQLALLTLFK